MITNKQKGLIEQVLFVLSTTKGLDFFHVGKILYFAEMKHIAKWGVSGVPDKFTVLSHGPTPTMLYDAVRHLCNPVSDFARELAGAVRFAGEDAAGILLHNREYDPDSLSSSITEALTASIDENTHLTFEQLKQKTQCTLGKVNVNQTLSPLMMAKTQTDDKAFLDYVAQQEKINNYFSEDGQRGYRRR